MAPSLHKTLFSMVQLNKPGINRIFSQIAFRNEIYQRNRKQELQIFQRRVLDNI